MSEESIPQTKRGWRIEINQDQFEQMLIIHCTLSEIAGVFRCSEDTIERWCERTYEQKFADIKKQFQGVGKMSLRRMMFDKARKGSDKMLIHLSEHHLDMKKEIKNSFDDKTHETIKLAYSLPTKVKEE